MNKKNVSLPRSLMLEDIHTLLREYYHNARLSFDLNDVSDIFTIRALLRDGKNDMLARCLEVGSLQMQRSQRFTLQKVYEHIESDLEKGTRALHQAVVDAAQEQTCVRSQASIQSSISGADGVATLGGEDVGDGLAQRERSDAEAHGIDAKMSHAVG